MKPDRYTQIRFYFSVSLFLALFGPAAFDLFTYAVNRRLFHWFVEQTTGSWPETGRTLLIQLNPKEWQIQQDCIGYHQAFIKSTRRLEVLKPLSLACGVFRGLYDILVQPSSNGDHSASADSSMIFIRNRTIAIHTEDTLAEFQTKQVLKSAIHKASYNRLVVSTPYICSSKDLPYQSFFNSLKQLLVHDKRPAALYSNPLELRLLTVELIADSKRSVVQQDWANYAHPFCLGLRMMKWMGHDAFMMSMCESSVLTMGELSDTIQNYWFSTVHEIVKMWFRRVLLTSSGLLIGGQLWNIRSFVEKLWNGQDIWENIEDAQIFNESPCSMRLRDWVEREGAGNWAVKSVNERWVGGHAALGYRGIELVAQLDPIRQSEY